MVKFIEKFMEEKVIFPFVEDFKLIHGESLDEQNVRKMATEAITFTECLRMGFDFPFLIFISQ